MGSHHLVRVGSLGRVGRFTSVDSAVYPRHARVILRTSRGLELGEVLAAPEPGPNLAPGDGSILRGMTVEDELLQARLERNRLAAMETCSRRLNEKNLPATLLDVEQLFDGGTLLFYFLGEVTSEIEAITAELAELYESQAQIRKFAETMTNGCGPGCGTEEAAGSGCQSCGAGCAIAGACGTKHTHAPQPAA
jgi:cell fate regulator YaaT (PSP1 superfamily)